MASLVENPSNIHLLALGSDVLRNVFSFLSVVPDAVSFARSSKSNYDIFETQYGMFCLRDFGIDIDNTEFVRIPTFETVRLRPENSSKPRQFEKHPISRTKSPKVIYHQFSKLVYLKRLCLRNASIKQNPAKDMVGC